MLIDTITKTSFLDNRIIRESFTRESAILIFNYLDSDDQQEEFDPQNIASIYHEADIEELKSDYKFYDSIKEASTLEEIKEELENYTHVLGISEEYDFRTQKTIRRLVFNSQF